MFISEQVEEEKITSELLARHKATVKTIISEVIKKSLELITIAYHKAHLDICQDQPSPSYGRLEAMTHSEFSHAHAYRVLLPPNLRENRT
ncbi:hypothetical protein MA03_03705 [Infirmifilum uzonense]|uniref:Uncharacterized protein n=1 Tax=Infirmifilum uzonense TaxID=1550241 RepID=A0A0F7FIE3_9CREN|nr:hypothetical protein [Infirmifilum uzonense]AKG38569.1 hypothetical protein MA03_03705 [Infirmifilum uzonense]